jgi:hypothetical protein
MTVDSMQTAKKANKKAVAVRLIVMVRWRLIDNSWRSAAQVKRMRNVEGSPAFFNVAGKINMSVKGSEKIKRYQPRRAGDPDFIADAPMSLDTFHV